MCVVSPEWQNDGDVKCTAVRAYRCVSVQGQSCLSWDVDVVDTLMNTSQTWPRLPVPGELYQPTSVSPGFSLVVSECQSRPALLTPLQIAQALPCTHTLTRTNLPSVCHTVTVQRCVSVSEKRVLIFMDRSQ